MEETGLRIGEVASRTGVSIDTLRYYEKRRLLGRARRSSGGFRLFAHEAVERVLFIKQAQEIGLSLEEIKERLAERSVVACVSGLWRFYKRQRISFKKKDRARSRAGQTRRGERAPSLETGSARV